MRIYVWCVGAALMLAACSPTAQQRAVVEGQLFCGRATATGPLTIALADASGVPIIVTNLAANTVASYCAAISAIPVMAPADPASAPVVALAVPGTAAGWKPLDGH